ncbi:MAG: glycine dehydrogenase (aminomethyl-transferring) [Burkholderiaceae bacterium]|nr:MAG: glycine dehydrogenase (aminomethyl-transferring) [Burkholderiaceae bacterium]
MESLPALRSLAELEQHDAFIGRHIGPDEADIKTMLAELGYDSLDAMLDALVPASIRRHDTLPLPPGFEQARSEAEVLAQLKGIAGKNKVFKSYIGMGYYGTHTPGVILRNILENPAWYTAYTPYQPEISQGRLEAILNFQTMIADLTGMDIANGSMLDEATAAAEAMTLALRAGKAKSKRLVVVEGVLPQTLEVVQTRAKPLGIEVQVLPLSTALHTECFAALVQYPTANGAVEDYSPLAQTLHAQGALLIAAADLLALTLLTPPGEWGADIAVGTSQRFGVPMGFGGPHAGYLATKDAFKRQMPGRLVGVSVDAQGNTAYRLALQTREQHIRREKATSNICTAQVLLAVIASMYAVYHGPQGLRTIAQRTQRLTGTLALGLKKLGFKIVNNTFFDTLTVYTEANTTSIHARAHAAQCNLRNIDTHHVGIALDETTTRADIVQLWNLFGDANGLNFDALETEATQTFAIETRTTAYLTHPVFNRYHSETEMLRYLRMLADKDIALDRAMIPLGSCTMKLNATSEMIPVTWPEFGALHPFAPADQTVGYLEMIAQLEQMLCAATGYDAVSLQPNAGSQGEYAGLLVIEAYHASRGESHRKVCLIPSSAHGTNPASAQMVDMQVVVVNCDAQGNVDIADLRAKAEQHSHNLAALMVTYPSTHGVFEAGIKEICDIVHQHGGQVYIDGANMNALVGTAAPGHFGGDVSHLNLHKTFCIPHGGGGPGVGPIGVRAHLAPFLPGHSLASELQDGKPRIGAVTAAPYGSASILPISWAYIAMMGAEGLKRATAVAMLNANYIARKLAPHYPVLYTGQNDLVAHECILDLRPLKESSGISNEDVAKRLIDFGFHAPTMSFPVPGTLMIEPTESESKAELDRFIEAMVAIRQEIDAVEKGQWPRDNNPLVHAPHTAQALLQSDWQRPYSREQAAYPVACLRQQKYWSPVGRVDNVYGDRNLFCACVPISEYQG